jgi:hypothetical protein
MNSSRRNSILARRETSGGATPDIALVNRGAHALVVGAATEFVAPPAILSHFADSVAGQPDSFRTALNRPQDQPACRSIVWLKRTR